MDTPFRPAHIDSWAIYLHCRYWKTRDSQIQGLFSRCADRWKILKDMYFVASFDSCKIADSRYQSIYNPTTDEWILQVLMIPTVLITFLINYEILLKQFISPKSINFNQTFSFQIKYLQKRDSGMYECQVHILQIYISKYWNWVEFKHFQWLV